MTTATLRNLAREAEQDLRFADAAQLYRRAIAAYPTEGSLADRDIMLLRKRAVECETFEMHQRRNL